MSVPLVPNSINPLDAASSAQSLPSSTTTTQDKAIPLPPPVKTDESKKVALSKATKNRNIRNVNNMS